MCTANLELNKKLYEKTLNFQEHGFSSDSSGNILRLCLSMEWQSSTSFHNKELLINLTDPTDPFFLYHLVIKGDDFLSLKQSQGLLVDFLAFPQSFIDLLSTCLLEDNSNEPRFVLQLTNNKDGSKPNTVTIDVLETNRFKLLTHLSLTLLAPSDVMVKQYLTTCFKDLKEENDSLKLKVNQLQLEIKKQVSNFNEARLEQQKNISSLEKEKANLLSIKRREFEAELARELLTASENHKREIRELKTKSSEKMKYLESRIREYEMKISEQEGIIQTNKEQINSLTCSHKEMNSLVKSVRAETHHINDRALSNSEMSEKLHQALRESEYQLEMARVTQINLEEQVAMKSEQIGELEKEVTNILEEKQTADDSLVKTLTELNICQTNEKKLNYDITKANNIIRKFQSEAREMHFELKHKSKKVTKLEIEVVEHDTLLQNLQRDMSTASNFIKSQILEIESLSKENQVLKSELAKQIAKSSSDEEQFENSADVVLKAISAGCQTTNSLHDLQTSTSKQQSVNYLDRISENFSTLKDTTNRPLANDHQEITTGNSAEPKPQKPKPVSLDPRFLERHPRCFARSRPVQHEDRNGMEESHMSGPLSANNNQVWRPFKSIAHS